jgi:hypothetical protein
MSVLNTIDFQAEAKGLCRLGGVRGVMLQKGPQIIASHLPAEVASSDALAEQVAHLFDGYQQVERSVKQVLFAYEKGCLLMLNENGVQMTLLLGNSVDLDLVAVTATLFFAEHAAALRSFMPPPPQPPVEEGIIQAPVQALSAIVTARPTQSDTPVPVTVSESVPPWKEVQHDLESILAKVLGGAQARSLITRVLKTVGVSDSNDLNLSESRSIALTILAEVPHRGKRESLIQELESLLSARAKR